MSLPNLPESTRKNRFKRWREYRRLGEELEVKDVMKMVQLNRKLGADGRRFGISNVGIELVPKIYEGLATASMQEYRIKGDGTLNLPSSINYDYRMIQELSLEELRSIGWHELGHYIFAYYFPDIENGYYRDYDKYEVTEIFADEFALRQFGDVFVNALEKSLRFIGKDASDRKANQERVDICKAMQKYRKRYNKPFWLAYAKKLKVKVEMKPETRAIVGIKPTKDVLKGLYDE